MPNESEQRRRKAILHELKAAERTKAEAALPASKDALKALFDWVDAHLESGCDHSLRHTLEYIKANGLDEERTVDWLREYGGYCDCEVVMNVEDGSPAFQ